MSYHGMGFSLPTGGPMLPMPTGRADTGDGSATSRAPSRATWTRFLALRLLLPRYQATLLRMRGRMSPADRRVLNTLLPRILSATVLANKIYSHETRRGPFTSWSPTSLRWIGDITRSGGIPAAAAMALIKRGRDRTALAAATRVRDTWNGFTAGLTASSAARPARKRAVRRPARRAPSRPMAAPRRAVPGAARADRSPIPVTPPTPPPPVTPPEHADGEYEYEEPPAPDIELMPDEPPAWDGPPAPPDPQDLLPPPPEVVAEEFVESGEEIVSPPDEEPEIPWKWIVLGVAGVGVLGAGYWIVKSA